MSPGRRPSRRWRCAAPRGSASWILQMRSAQSLTFTYRFIGGCYRHVADMLMSDRPAALGAASADR